MSNKTPNRDVNCDQSTSIGSRSPATKRNSKAAKVAQAALSVLIFTGSMAGGAQAKGNKDTFVCISSYTVIVCKKHDSLGRCTRIGKKKMCNGWKKVVVSSRVTQPGPAQAKQ